jgi:hypothetical protein
MHAIGSVMTGYTRRFENTLPRLEADEPINLGSSQLFVMPVRTGTPSAPLVFRRQRNNVVPMPLRDKPSLSAARPLTLLCGNAVECWPRGYPSNDDL